MVDLIYCTKDIIIKASELKPSNFSETQFSNKLKVFSEKIEIIADVEIIYHQEEFTDYINLLLKCDPFTNFNYNLSTYGTPGAFSRLSNKWSINKEKYNDELDILIANNLRRCPFNLSNDFRGYYIHIDNILYKVKNGIITKPLNQLEYLIK